MYIVCTCSVPAGLSVTASMGFDIVTTSQSGLVPDELDETLTEDTGKTVAISVPSTDGGTLDWIGCGCVVMLLTALGLVSIMDSLHCNGLHGCSYSISLVVCLNKPLLSHKWEELKSSITGAYPR